VKSISGLSIVLALIATQMDGNLMWVMFALAIVMGVISFVVEVAE
jgi:hypothetical protein